MEFIQVNEKYIPDEGYYFGNGLFETIHVVAGQPLRLSRHLARMTKSAIALGFLEADREPVFYQELKEKILSHLEGRWKGKQLPADVVLKVAYACGTLHFQMRENTYTEEDYERGFAVEFSKILRNETSPFTYHKSLNYGDNIREKRRAHIEGFDEPIFLNTRGEVTEGATTNIFLIKDYVIYYPPVSSGLLAGTMRSALLDFFLTRQEQDFDGNDQVCSRYQLQEKILYPQDIKEAEDMFLTNALLGVMPVWRCQETVFARRSKILTVLQEMF